MNKADFIPSVVDKVYTQSYEAKPVIEGVKIVKLTNFISEEGDFSEILRLDSAGEVEGLPGFKIAQINRTKLMPQAVKAWHVHYNQDELFYVAPIYDLFIGLWDVRKGSKTEGVSMRMAVGSGNSQLVYVPHGVAHGNANFSYDPIQMYYFINNKFDVNNPDEHRIPWDALGADFWTPQRD